MIVKTPRYDSKYNKIIKKYSLPELQNLLDSCKSKTALCDKLGISLKYFNIIIELNNLEYSNKIQGVKKGFVHKPMKINHDKTVEVRLTQEMISEDTALARFYKEIAEKKKKRMLKDLLDPYGD